MKIIGFVGSSRKEGNTAWVVDRILEGAKEQGAETQSWYFSDLDIKPCQGCLGCRNSDRGCVIDDDMQGLYDAVDEADTLVFGSPVYMGQMSAQAKTFVDRWFSRITPRFKEAYAGKKLILVFTQGNPDPGTFQVYFDYTKLIFQLLEFDVGEVVVAADMPSEPPHERKDLHTAMNELGASLVLA